MNDEEKKEAQQLKEDLASMTPEQREEYERLVQKNQEMDEERERYLEADGLIADLIRANTKESKEHNDFIRQQMIDYEWKFVHKSRSFIMVMLAIIALTLIYIAFNI